MDYMLGLDIGSASIGWALLRLDGGRPAGILHTGVRVFEAGVEGDIEAGRAESRGLKRRSMRAHGSQAAHAAVTRRARP